MLEGVAAAAENFMSAIAFAGFGEPGRVGRPHHELIKRMARTVFFRCDVLSTPQFSQPPTDT